MIEDRYEELSRIDYGVYGSGEVTTDALRMPANLGAGSHIFVDFEGAELRAAVLLAATADSAEADQLEQVGRHELAATPQPSNS
jgi:hypothetical protein